MRIPDGDPDASNYSIYEPQLQTPILRHPSISQDQQVVAALQQTSKQMQEAVAQLLSRQLPVVLHPSRPQQLELPAQWLCQHAGLVKSLDVQFTTPGHVSKPYQIADRASELESALVAAASAASPSNLQLQSLSINVPVESHLLQHLPAAHLTQLDAVTNLKNKDCVDAIARLTNLQELRLTHSDLVQASDDVLRQVTANMQRLTQLHVDRVLPMALQHLPPQLQQLHAVITEFH